MAFWGCICADGALGTDVASCVHPAGTRITAKKTAAIKRAATC
jgi:hypothetical protein